MLTLSRAVALALSLSSVALVALSGCGGGDGEPQRTATTTVTDPDNSAPSPNRIELEPPAGLDDAAREQWLAGRDVAAQSGCLACHTIGTAGNQGPGPELTRVGARLTAARIAATLRDPMAPMPSFASLEEAYPERFDALVAFVATLR